MARFDPTHAIRFDIASGQISIQGGAPRLLVPLEALVDLALAAGDDALRDFGHRMGTEVGRRIAARLDPQKASPEEALDQIATELAVLGLGSMALERWGRALVPRISGLPAGAELLAASVLEGVMQRTFARDVRVVVLDADDEAGTRFLLASEGAAQRASAWLSEGQSYGDVLVRLQGAAS